MAMSDPIADMLTRIRNAGKAKFNSVDIPGSKLKTELAKVLKNEGFIKNYKFLKDNKQGILRVYLKYGQDKNSAIFGIERISRPGRRTYVKNNELKPVFSGMGLAVLSTSKGVMTDKRAAKEKLGGEVLCKVW
ncbi:MAG: 30S ribosomal protein S8 [Desulfobacteraceae bacterium]|nr:MAG: 30S ribosomal protein S8 [Desulfobacteraceae bacterium]